MSHSPSTKGCAISGRQDHAGVCALFHRGWRARVSLTRDVRGFCHQSSTPMKATGTWSATTCRCFFIRTIKFPDLIHAVKPEPHNAMPQAGSAHTLLGFCVADAETTHMLMWAMSDRAIPRSYATMQGFGVHAFGWSMPPVVGVYQLRPPRRAPIHWCGP
jgi:catalase